MVFSEVHFAWAQYLLWAALLLVAHTWFGYAVLILLLQRICAPPPASRETAELPSISVIVAAHNEEQLIATKLHDCLNLDYPNGLLEILVVSDNSTDSTEQIVSEFALRDPRIRLLRTQGRAGKSGAQNLAAEHAHGEIFLLTDANTHTQRNTLKRLVANFADPQVGLVSATVYFGHPVEAISKGQGLYWKYEYVVRQAESDIGILATAGGQAMAMRKCLFRPIALMYGDDCVLPLDVRLQNYRVLNDRHVVVFDTSPHTIEGELRARIRMTTRNWAGTLSRPALLNPLRFPMTAFGIISHKLLRWLTPFLLSLVFILNTFLVFRNEQVGLWFAQVLFYACAIVGWLLTHRQKPAGIFAYPFSLCLANLGFFLGLIKVLRRQKITAYK